MKELTNKEKKANCNVGARLRPCPEKGITLVALVITIILLIILAGVSINAVMNDGLIGNAQSARDEFEKEKYKEEDALGYLGALTEYVDVTITNVNTAETNPEAALPDGAVIIEGDANKGIVIKDSNNNEWVWVEVPKSIYTTATSSTDYTNIETDMQTYAADYRKDGYSDTYNSGCGFASSTDYNNHKYSMLKSVYENGGFWIGRYEAGTRTARTTKSDALPDDIVIQQDMYPYNWITVPKSQQIANKLSTGGKTGSLMFGIQWDLLMKFIETKGYLTNSDGTISTTKITFDMLNKEILELGNFCYSPNFQINRGQYTSSYFVNYTVGQNLYPWKSYDTDSEYVTNKVKLYRKSVLLTTGAADRNRILNIYDVAGNLQEWTLETASGVSVARGSSFNTYNKDIPVTHRTNSNVTGSEHTFSFRPVMW